MSYKSGFYKGRLGIGLANTGGDGTGNPRFPLDVNGDIRLTGSLLRSDGTPYLGGGLINYIPKGIKSIVNNDGGYFVGFGTHTPTEALDISGNLKVSGQILSVDGDNFSTVVPITQQQTTTENPTWHGDVTTTVTSSSDSETGLALKANIATPTFTSNLKIEQTGTNNNTLIINANNHNNGIDIEAFQSDSTSTKKKLCLNPYGGNVGIGTTSPDAKLHVNATSTLGIYSMGDYTDFNYILNGPRPGKSKGDGAVLYITSENSASHEEDSTFTIRNDSGPIRLGKNNSKTTIEGNNIILNSNVGIGTTSPQSRLDIHKTLVETGLNEADGIRFSTTATNGTSTWNWSLGYIGGYNLANNGTANGFPGGIIFKTKEANSVDDHNLTTRMVIDAAGNVGIGTDSPERTLHLYGSRTDIVFDGNNSGGNFEKHYIRKDGHYLRFRGNDDSTVLFELRNNSTGSNACSFPSGNVGIGTTSPDQKLDIGGSGGNGTGRIRFTDTENVANARNWFMGPYRSNDAAFQIIPSTTKGGSSPDVTKTFCLEYTGNVGIGTTSPGEKLEIGENSSTHDNTDKKICVSQQQQYKYNFGITKWNKYSSGSGKYDLEIGYQDIGNNNSNYGNIILTPYHNVGIGTTEPEFHLDIRGSGDQIINVYSDGTGDAYARFSYNNNADAGLFYVGALATSCMLNSRFNYPMIFYIDNTEAMRINTNRYLGIGTTSPAAPLHVHGSDHQVQPQAIFSVAGHGGNTYHSICGYGMHHIDNYYSSTIQPYGSTSGGTAIYFNYYSQGFVSLCRNTCQVHSGFTEFKHPANDGGTKPYTSGIIVLGNEGGYAPSIQCTRWGTWADGVDLEIHIASTNAGRSKAFWVAGRQNHGKVYASGSFNNSSDDRKKHNETKVSNGLEIINKLTAKKYFKSVELKETSFDYELDNSGIPITTDTWMEEIGFIAQEIQKIPELKHCVSGEEYVNEVKKTYKKDASDNIIRDASGNKIVEKEDIIKKPNSLSLRYNDLFVCNIVATQELYKENEELKTKVANLESELAAIKAHLGI